jgi:adenylate cyclase
VGARAVQLDSNLPEAQAILSQVLGRRGEHDAAIAAFERAMALNPNFMDWRFAEVLVLAGEPERAIAAVERHMRMDPFYAPLAPGWLGLAHYMLKQYSPALSPSRECAAQAPNVRLGHLGLAAAYAQLGKLEEAGAEAAELLRIYPKFTISKTARTLPFKRTEDAEHFFDGLRKAGLPEK